MHDEREMADGCEEVYRSLRERFNGGLLRPRDSGYEEARAVWKACSRAGRA